MATLNEQRAAVLDEAAALEAKGAEMTEAEAQRMVELAEKAAELTERIKAADTAKGALNALSSVRGAHPTEAPKGRTLGERFVKSDAMRGVRATFPKGISDEQAKSVNIVARNLAPMFRKADDDTDTPAAGGGSSVIYRGAAGLPAETFDPTIVDFTAGRQLSILNLITHGTTDAGSLRYRQIIAVENNAAIVPESTDITGDAFVKPISNIELAPATAVDATYADGFYITTQEFNDDGALVALVDSFLRRNIELKTEDMILNGSGEGAEPLGILNVEGLNVQPFETDILTTVRKARTVLDVNDYVPSALVVSPADAEKIDLLKAENGSFYGGGPVAAGNLPTLWGVPVVVSAKLEEGTALMGDFSTIHLLTREALQINVFDQHMDFAQRNLLYLRAEYRGLQLLRAPAAFVKVQLGN